MKKTIRVLFVLLMLFVSPVFSMEDEVPWPKATHTLGVPGTDPNLQEYATSIVQQYPVIKSTDAKEILTLNRMGTVTHYPEAYAEKFVAFSRKQSLPILSIGEGTGNIVFKALNEGITFIANDLDPRHLAHLYAEVPAEQRGLLYLKSGKFPEEIELPNESVGAIYFGRVFHFMEGEEIDRALPQANRLLPRGGKIFGRASTPFQKHLQFFLPTYYERIEKGIRWPGICTDMQRGWPTLHEQLPSFMHLLDKDPLKVALESADFEIEELEYTPIQHPEFILDGREGIGFVAVKR